MIATFLIFVESQGRSQKWPKGGVLKVQGHRGYMPDRHFVTIWHNLPKNLDQWGGGSDPHIAPWLRPCSRTVQYREQDV